MSQSELMNFIALIFPTGTYKTSSSKNIEEDICQMVATIRPFELLEMAADIIWTAFLQDCDVLLLKSVFLPNSFVLYSHFDSEKLAQWPTSKKGRQSDKSEGKNVEMLDNYIIVYISTCFLYLSWYTNANVQTTSLCPLMETNSDLCPESPTTINWLDLGLFWVTIIIITIIFLSPYLSQPLSSPQPDWVKVFISATVANIVLKKLNMQFWMKSLFTLSQILKQHHWQPVPNDEMTSPYSWVIIRKIFHRWPGFTDLILAFYLSLKELSLLPLSVERLESSIPRSWQMSVVFLHFCTSGFKPCLGICFLCIAYDNVVQLPGKPICSGAKSPSSPEGAFSEAPVFTLFFLLDKTVFLDLTNQSRHFYSDQMRVDTEGWLRRNLEVWSGPVLACRSRWQRWLAWQRFCPRWQRWERGQSQTSLHLSQRLQTV